MRPNAPCNAPHANVSEGLSAALSFPRSPAAGPTQYEKAIMGIGAILEHYDHDKVQGRGVNHGSRAEGPFEVVPGACG